MGSELSLRLVGADVLRPDGLERAGSLAFSEGLIGAECGREIDLTGYMILPGLIDMHGDGFERHVAVRRGAMKDMAAGLRAAEAELAVNGVTTAVLAQFYSWEGGLRGPAFADAMLTGLGEIQADVLTDMRPQLRFETHMLDDYAAFEALVAKHGVGYVVFNDHIQHERFEQGRMQRRVHGIALKSGRNPAALEALLQRMHDERGHVPESVTALAQGLASRGVRLGSHDENTREDRDFWSAAGVDISEFPETQEAAEAARAGGAGVILGAPNVVRGGSHKGNASAVELIAMGLCDALASDYHYPSLRRAAFFLEEAGLRDLPGAWALVSSGPARLLGLEDRGTLETGMRADLMIVEAESRRVTATFAGGRISHMSGEIAERFIRSGS